MPLPPDAAAALGRLEWFGVRLGLERMRRLLAALGDPQRKLPAVLVAGTNGKGSTSAFLAAMGTAAGYRTGLYTSPHLEAVEERLRIDGRPVAGDRLGRRILEVVAAAGRASEEPPTYFEALTAVAFAELAEEGVELAVLEVGLGGRLDATNLADPVLSLITPISLEHREYLGDTLATIAGEKAGVMRRGRPVVAWTAEPEVEAALAAAAGAAGAELRFGRREAAIVATAPAGSGEAEVWSGQRVEVATPGGRHSLATTLLGGHQARNLAHAVLAAETLRTLGWPRLDVAAIAAGAAAARWPGRLEVVDLGAGAAGGHSDDGPEGGKSGADPGDGRPERERAGLPRRVLLDVAHNPGAAAELAAFLGSLPPPPDGSPRKIDLLFGILGDKDAAATLAPLLPLTRRRVLTRPPHDRGRDPAEVAALTPAGTGLLVEPDPAAALDLLLAPPSDRTAADTLLVCGSFYLVGTVRALLRRRFGLPPPEA